MAHSNTQLRRTLVDACRILDQHRLVHGYGHVSARAANGNTVLVSPRQGLALVRTPQAMLQIDLDGKPVRLKGSRRQSGKRAKNKALAPLEIYLHTEIYRARPDVKAICRTHGIYALVLSVLRRTLRPVHELGVALGPEVPLLDSPVLIDTPEIGMQLVAALGAAQGLLLRGNGAVAVGASVEEAVVNAILMESSAEVQYRALAVGEPAWIAGAEYDKEYARLAKRGPEAVNRPWQYYLARSRAR